MHATMNFPVTEESNASDNDREKFQCVDMKNGRKNSVRENEADKLRSTRGATSMKVVPWKN